jgi:hypothetical protein
MKASIQKKAGVVFKSCIAIMILVIPPVWGDDYDDFNNFCIDNFGAEKEEEIYRMFGQNLEVLPSGDWECISERSACICWETNLPAKTKVHYGTTPSYNDSTEMEERHLFLHVHYLRDLMSSTLYHYSIVSTDERGNQIASEDRTFTTQTPANLVRVPGDLPGSAPYTIDQVDATYLVTEDITAPSTVFNIAGNGITLDLGGHTIIYDNIAGSPDPIPPGDWGWHAIQGPCGIRAKSGVSTRILNGVVKQGEGNGPPDSVGWSYYPIFLRRPLDSEIAGVTVEYTGSQVIGIFVDNDYAGDHIHHNVVVDRGIEIVDRHRGLDGIGARIAECHHNLIKRVRHRGIRTGTNTNTYSNEIYIDSWATNSFGIMYYSSGDPVHHISIHDNRIFGTGYHPIGIGSGLHAHDVGVFSNYVQMQGQAPSTYRWPGGPGDPTGQEHPVNGIRFHEGPQQNIDYHDNTVVVKARGVPEEGAMMRGLWITPLGEMENVVFHNNVIKQIAQNEFAVGRAVAALGGDPDDSTTVITYRDNTISANTCNIRFGDNYGHGGKHHFVSATLVKIGNDPRYKTIKLGWNGWNYDSYGHTFLDSEFEDGASYDEVSFEGAGSAYYDFTVNWSLLLRTHPGAGIVIQDVNSDTVFEGTMGGDGEEEIPLSQYLRTNSGDVSYTPHTVRVAVGLDSVDTVIVMDQRRILEIYLSIEEDNAYTGLPETYSLSQSYPNPVVQRTIINYQLAAKSKVSLKVHDVTGRLVTILVSKSMDAGYHSAEWDANGVAPGIYFATLTAGTHKDSKKLIRIK